MLTIRRRFAPIAALAIALAGCTIRPLTPPPGEQPHTPQVAPTDPASAPVGQTAPSKTPLGSPFADAPNAAAAMPLVIDRGDMRLGTTVQMRRLPSLSELHDLTLLPGLARIVLTFDEWPREYAAIDVLNQLPQGVELVVVLPGWPPDRAAVDAWNYLSVPVRIAVLVAGPPESVLEVSNLNEMRGLERVIAQMDDPSRAGFERLQRPLNFRKIIE